MKNDEIKILIQKIWQLLESDGYLYDSKNKKFERKSKLGKTYISYSCKIASDGSHYTLHIRCGIHVSRIEEIYTKFHPLLGKDNQKNNETVSILYGNKPVFKNSISEPFLPSEFEEKYSSFKACYNDDISDFFDKYDNLNSIYENLYINEKSQRIISNPVSRYSFLLSFCAIELDQPLFTAISNEAIAFINKPFGSQHKSQISPIIEGIKSEYFEKP